MITVLIVYLIIIVYINTSTSNTIGQLKLNSMAAQTKFAKEEIIYNAVNSYILDNSAMPADIDTLKNNNYLYSSFDNGSFQISLDDHNTTLMICSNFDNNNTVYRNMYMHHYKGRQYGYAPVVGTTTDVCHPFQLRLSAIDLL